MNTPQAPARIAEICSGLSCLLFGLWFLSPMTDTFASAVFGGTYTLLGHYANENVWGFIFYIAGSVMLFGAVTQRRAPRIIGSLSVLILRLFLFVLTGMVTNFTSQGVPEFAVWALLAFFVLLQAMRHAD